MKGLKLFYFDVETTGLSSFKHSIIQIAAAVEIDGKLQDKKIWECQPIPGSTIDPEALKVTGTTLDDLRGRPTAEETLIQFKRWLENWVDPYKKDKDRWLDKFTPIAYNGRFDVGFLERFFKRQGDDYFGAWFNGELIDPLVLVRLARICGAMTTIDAKLATVYEAISRRPLADAHDAGADLDALRLITRPFIHLLTTVALGDNDKDPTGARVFTRASTTVSGREARPTFDSQSDKGRTL